LLVIRIPNIGNHIKSDKDIRRLTHAIVSSGNVLLREAGRLFKPHGLTAVQFNVLNILAAAPAGLRAAEITAALVVDASSTTYVLDRMESLGWLQRLDHESDRRAWRIRLTPAGRRLHARVGPLYSSALREVLRDFDPAGVAALVAGLDSIQRAAGAAVDRVLAGPRKK
jgi:DNA-binding MarR family transcriptional regulator